MPRCFRSQLAWLVAAVLLLFAPPALASAQRLALVVGNGAYAARPLATAANDAALVAQALAQAGFEVVARRDLDAASLRAALAAFVATAREAGPDATLFVYFSGYGVQYGGGNFLVPVDARLVHDDDTPAEAARLDDLIRGLAAVPAKARLLVFDASRAQPFATIDEMPLAPGFGLTIAPKGTLVAFAAAPGMVAPDDALPYGAYARALAETIAAPGVSANDLFDRVRLRVGTLTNGEQVPWDDGVVDGGVTFTAGAAPAAATPATPAGTLSPDAAYSVVIARDTLASYAEFLRVVADPPLATRVRVLQAVRREATMWQAVAAADDPRAAWTYMRRYPRGPHRFDARRRLAALHAALGPPPRFDPYVFPALPPPTPAELPMVAAPEQALRDLPTIPAPPTALLPPADPAYYDELPMPAPAPTGLLPIVPPLPGAAGGEPGHVTQVRSDGGLAVAETRLAPNGSGSITLADADGSILELVAGDAAGDQRVLIETGAAPAANATRAAVDGDASKSRPSAAGATPNAAGAKLDTTSPPELSRIVVQRMGAGVTIALVDADGATRLAITTVADVEGARTTRVTNGADALLASWRRDARGIIVTRNIAAPASVAKAPPVPMSGPAEPPPRAPPAAPSAPSSAAAFGAAPVLPKLAPPAPPAQPAQPTPRPTSAAPPPVSTPAPAAPASVPPIPPRRPATNASKPARPQAVHAADRPKTPSRPRAAHKAARGATALRPPTRRSRR